MPSIPEPELVGDVLTGSLCQGETGVILLVGAAPLPLERLLRPAGTLVIRYALPYLYEPVAIVPGLFASEYGEFLVGRAAWDYAQRHFTLHPRADLVGLRTDGQRDQVMIRALDFGCEVEVYAYAGPDDVLPLARLVAFWADPALSEALPDMLRRYLPHLDHLPA